MTMTPVYTRTGRVAHLLREGVSPNSSYPALCGTSPQDWGGMWYGTGTQEEHEIAAGLPLCQKCAVEKQRTEGRERERASRRGHE